MRFRLLLFAALTFLFTPIGNLSSFAQVEPGRSFTGIAYVDDADEYQVVPISGSRHDDSRSNPITVTLSDVHAPAIGQPYHDKAKNAARRLTEGDTVHVTVEETEAGGPFVTGRIQTQDGNLSKILVSSGHVWARSSRLDSLEVQAQRAEQGLWSNPAPIPPWMYEKLERWARVIDPRSFHSCSDFGNYSSAQFFFQTFNDYIGPNEEQELWDTDGDGVVCEYKFDLPFIHEDNN